MSSFSAGSAGDLSGNASGNLPALLDQFRAAYPAASLIADLLTVQNGRYVVRVSVVMGGLTLATGLAESASIEEAEDRARGRSLQALGFHGLGLNAGAAASVQAAGQVGRQAGRQAGGHMPGAIALPSTPSAPMDAAWNSSPSVLPSGSLPDAGLPVDGAVSSLPPIAPASDLATEAATLPTESDWDKPDPIAPPLPPEDELDPGPAVADFYTHISASDESAPDDSEPVDLSKITKPASQISAKPSRKKSASSPSEPAPPAPAPASIDFSDILAETDVELRRLGWDAKRGREHLKATYSKRSRQELNETELYDFLDYLKAQPTP